MADIQVCVVCKKSPLGCPEYFYEEKICGRCIDRNFAAWAARCVSDAQPGKCLSDEVLNAKATCNLCSDPLVDAISRLLSDICTKCANLSDEEFLKRATEVEMSVRKQHEADLRAEADRSRQEVQEEETPSPKADYVTSGWQDILGQHRA